MQSSQPAAGPATGQTPASTAAQQNVFTPEQLHSLRNQILAFRAVKVGSTFLVVHPAIGDPSDAGLLSLCAAHMSC